METAGKIDIVVVNWNAGILLNRCIQSILTSEQPQLLGKIIVVDNASTDGSLASLPQNPLLYIIQNTANKGFAFACNQGVENSTSEYVVMVNPDVKLFADTMYASFQFMEQRKDVDIMGCTQLNEEGGIWPSTSRFPKAAHFWNDALGLSKLLPGIFKPATLATDWDHKSSRFVDQVMGSYMFIRRNVFEKIGMFDTRFFVYFEEIDLSKRLADAGGRSFYNHSIQLLHTGNATTEHVKAFRLFLSINSRLLYSQKHFTRAGRVSTFIATLFVEPVSRTLFSLFKGGREDAVNTVKGYSLVWQKWLFGKKVIPDQFNPIFQRQ